ncbi:MAG: T9SS type A sorting domain-containing protein [Bacteroidetes bacterium]|nr:T9SS type A sorting domain-containing protein [Bacteroidota bacterium]
MKNVFSFLILSFFNPLLQTSFAQCNNPDFETGDSTGWEGWTGYHPNSGIIPSCCPVPGFVAGRFAIVSGAGIDPCGGFSVVAPGGSYSLKLGNNSVGAQADRVTMSFNVSTSNTNFIYQYAVVLEEPGHPVFDQPFFEIKMTDTAGNNIPCSYYYVAAGQGVPGFQNSGTCLTSIYKPWTTGNVDLTAYVGQTVTMQFTVSDCAQTGHYAYAYVDAACFPFSIVQYDSLCNASNPITIYAPAGVAGYNWSPGGQTTQNIQVDSSGNYCVQMTTIQGCIKNLCHQVNLLSGITADFNESPQCNLLVNFSDNTTGGTVTQWSWDFGDSSPVDNSQNPSHYFLTDTPYNVILTVETTAGCIDSIVKQVKPFSDPDVAITGVSDVACNNGSDGFASISITGGTPPYSILWNDILTQTTLTATGLSAGTYFATVTDSTGCTASDSAIITEPSLLVIDSMISVNASCPDTTCPDGSASVYASGGTSPYYYLWNTGDTTATLSNVPSDTFFVTVTDDNGCTVSGSVIVDFAVDALPYQGKNFRFYVFPNPAKDKIIINFFNRDESVPGIEIMDITGKKAYSDNPDFVNSLEVNVKGWDEGIYYVKISGTDGFVGKPFVVVK